MFILLGRMWKIRGAAPDGSSCLLDALIFQIGTKIHFLVKAMILYSTLFEDQR